jgi:hypothetical protein
MYLFRKKNSFYYATLNGYSQICVCFSSKYAKFFESFSSIHMGAAVGSAPDFVTEIHEAKPEATLLGINLS